MDQLKLAYDIAKEKLLAMAAVPSAVPGRPHASTVWRWYKRGVSGVKLETLVCGGRRFTSEEALARFFAATTAAKDGIVPERVPCRRRKAQIDAAEAELERAGI